MTTQPHEDTTHAQRLVLLGWLTPTEAEILGGLMLGHSVAQIAKQRWVAESTVRHQVKAILAKTGARSQTQAVAWAYLAGWTLRPGTDAGAA